MAILAADDNRPPYVAWEYRQIEDRETSLKSGHYASKDVAFAIITRPGSRDDQHQNALEWLAELKRKKHPWFDGFSASFKAWQLGEELPTVGTPIKGWPILAPSAQKDLIHQGIRTVEDLAALPDSAAADLGMGGISFKQKAVAWLLSAKDTGKAAEEIVAQNVKITELAELTKKLIEENKALRATLPAKAT